MKIIKSKEIWGILNAAEEPIIVFAGKNNKHSFLIAVRKDLIDNYNYKDHPAFKMKYYENGIPYNLTLNPEQFSHKFTFDRDGDFITASGSLYNIDNNNIEFVKNYRVQALYFPKVTDVTPEKLIEKLTDYFDNIKDSICMYK